LSYCSLVLVIFLVHVYATFVSHEKTHITHRVVVACFLLCGQQLGHRVAGLAHEQRVRRVVYLLAEIMAATRPLREREFSDQGPRCVCIFEQSLRPAIHIYTYICIYTHTYIDILELIYICIHIRVYIYIYSALSPSLSLRP